MNFNYPKENHNSLFKLSLAVLTIAIMLSSSACMGAEKLGKRPRTTLTPTLVLKDGKAVAAANVAGGDLQDQSSLQLLINHIDFGMTPKECVGPPRFFTKHYVGSFNQPPPELGSLYLNKDIDPKIISDLKERGHKVTLIDGPHSHDVILTVEPESGLIRAAGDPKTERHAAAF